MVAFREQPREKVESLCGSPQRVVNLVSSGRSRRTLEVYRKKTRVQHNGTAINLSPTTRWPARSAGKLDNIWTHFVKSGPILAGRTPSTTSLGRFLIGDPEITIFPSMFEGMARFGVGFTTGLRGGVCVQVPSPG